MNKFGTVLTGVLALLLLMGMLAGCTRGEDSGRVTITYTSFGALRGSRAIAQCWMRCVNQLGSYWTIDHMIVDPKAQEVVIEWTHFKLKVGQILRGDEWYRFNDEGLITEIKAYYACPTHDDVLVHQVGGYPYAERGYPMDPPPEAQALRS